MTSKDQEYYRQRAATERELAKEAANEAAAKRHQEMADLYELLNPADEGRATA